MSSLNVGAVPNKNVKRTVRTTPKDGKITVRTVPKNGKKERYVPFLGTAKSVP